MYLSYLTYDNKKLQKKKQQKKEKVDSCSIFIIKLNKSEVFSS